MPVCARAVQMQDGSYLLAIDPSETNPSTCAYVVETGAESLIGSLATMTPEDAAVYATATAFLWATAWGIKEVIRSLRESDHVEES
jgi:hypothetical protein